MSNYKFSQVVDAICQSAPAQEVGERDVTFRLKRLLALDRKLGRHPRNADQTKRCYAFFGEKPLGRGVDVQFSAYEAFALFAAHSMLDHGLPQLTAIGLLRKARPQLEAAHVACLTKDPAKLFDEEELQRRPELWSLDATEPVTLIAVGLREPSRGSDDDKPFAVCLSRADMIEFAKKYGQQPGVGFTFFPFARAMHNFAAQLAAAPVRNRGRQPRNKRARKTVCA